MHLPDAIPLVAQLTHRRSPEVAEVLRSESGPIDHIFEASNRGNVHGQPGVGWGLAMGSQAAKLLGAQLAVETSLATGLTFRLYLPAPSHGLGEGAERPGL